LFVEQEHALADTQPIHAHRKQLLGAAPIPSSPFRAGLVRTTVGIDDQVSHRVLEVKLAQGDLASQHAQDLDGDARVIHVRVSNITGFFASMNGKVVELELEAGEVPDKILKFDPSSGHRPKLADQPLPYSVAKRIAVEVESQADNGNHQHHAAAKLYPARASQRVWVLDR